MHQAFVCAVNGERYLRQCRLDLGAVFHLDGSVPADDQVTSLSPIGGNAHHGAVAFTTTHWSVVLEAQGESPAAQEALEKLCRTYWRPVYAFVRRQGVGPVEAEDITQGFFAQLLERRKFSALRKEKGRLRSFLLGALKNYVQGSCPASLLLRRFRYLGQNSP